MGIQQIGDLPRVKRWGLNKQQIRKKRLEKKDLSMKTMGEGNRRLDLKRKIIGVGQIRDLKSYENRFAGKKKSQRMNNKTKQ